MSTAVRCQTLLGVMVFAAACSNGTPQPTTPTSIAATPTVNPTPAPAPISSDFVPRFPTVSSSARIYVAAKWPVSSYHGSPLASRYVLHDDGTFSLQYSSARNPFFEYKGAYSEADGLIGLDFGPGWDRATALRNGDSLTVRYSIDMQMSDFEDGTYIRESR